MKGNLGLLTFGLTLFSTLWCRVNSAKILLLPANSNSHVFYFLDVGEALMKESHDVHMLLSPRYPRPQRVNDTKAKLVFYTPKDTENFDMPNSEEQELEFIEASVKYADKLDFITSSRYFREMRRSLCTNPLSDEDLFKRLKQINFDFALIDGFLGNRCKYTLLYKLGVPYGTLMTMYEPWLSRTPALPSFVPFMLTTSYTEKMTFWQRLYNVYCMIDLYAWPRISNLEDAYVSTYVPEKPFLSLNYLAGQSQIWLQNTDVAIDYPLPLMPNMIPIGGLTTRPSKPLPADLEKFVQESEDGIIVVSFGSILRLFPDYLLEKFLETFGKVKQRVIFRLPKVEQAKNPPPNVLIRKWIPQNDLLGHPKTKLFITHCGNNGQFEALYHGIPMIGFPIFADQPYNAARMEYKGYGVRMSLDKFTPDELVKNINRVIEDKSYKEAISVGSEIFKSDEMTPKERALYWLDHVLTFGGDHLHSYALEMPWYEYLMLDIVLFIIVCVCLLVFVTYHIMRVLGRLLFGPDKLKTQ